MYLNTNIIDSRMLATPTKSWSTIWNCVTKKWKHWKKGDDDTKVSSNDAQESDFIFIFFQDYQMNQRSKKAIMSKQQEKFWNRKTTKY